MIVEKPFESQEYSENMIAHCECAIFEILFLVLLILIHFSFFHVISTALSAA